MTPTILAIRSDVVAALEDLLLDPDTVCSVLGDAALAEAYGRSNGDFHDREDPGIDCRMSGDIVALIVPPEPEGETVNGITPPEPLTLLQEALTPGETLDGVATAVLIGEIRERRTGILPYVTSADEPVMPDDLLELESIILNAADEEADEASEQPA